jgi:drug/metabolite transporter (DMT)-like permease
MALLGWMIFSEIPGTWTWVGGLIIFMSTIYISHREAKATNSLKPITALRKQNSKGDL